MDKIEEAINGIFDEFVKTVDEDLKPFPETQEFTFENLCNKFGVKIGGLYFGGDNSAKLPGYIGRKALTLKYKHEYEALNKTINFLIQNVSAPNLLIKRYGSSI